MLSLDFTFSEITNRSSFFIAARTASAFGSDTASYEAWLRVARRVRGVAMPGPNRPTTLACPDR